MLARQFCQWAVPKAETGSVLCVGLHLEDMAAWASQCVPYTTEQERREASRFSQMADAVRHLAGRALARRMLCAATGQNSTPPFARTPYGKPFCPQTDIDFSISHAAHMVWVALCRTASVGIDVEQLRALPDAADLTSQLHLQERQALLALPEGELEKAFLRCWTRKEAVLKACGTGLNTPLHSFCVSTGPQKSDWLLAAPEAVACPPPCAAATPAHTTSHAPGHVPDQWTSHDITAAPNYQCSVAACGPHLEVLVRVM